MGLAYALSFYLGIFLIVSGLARISTTQELPSKVSRLIGLVLVIPYVVALSTGSVSFIFGMTTSRLAVERTEFVANLVLCVCVSVAFYLLWRARRQLLAQRRALPEGQSTTSATPSPPSTWHATSTFKNRLGLVAVFCAWNWGGAVIVYGSTMAASAVARITGHAWDSSRAASTSEFRTFFRASQAASGLELPELAVDSIVACVVDHSIAYLNTTACVPSAAITGGQEDPCLKGIGYESKLTEFSLLCQKLHFPNDWRVMLPAFRAAVIAATSETARQDPGFSAGVDCLADGVVQAFTSHGCPVVNQKATSSDDFFNQDTSLCSLPGADDTRLRIQADCLRHAPGQGEPPAIAPSPTAADAAPTE